MSGGWSGFGIGSYRRRKNKKGRKRGKSAKFKDNAFSGRRTIPCYYCGKRLTREQATTDHVRALSQGGYDRKGNFVIACSECNTTKGRKSAGEHASSIRSLAPTLLPPAERGEP